MYVRAKVTTGAKRDALSAEGEALVVSVKAPAEQNLANESVCRLVAAHFGVPRAAVRIVSGHHRPAKRLFVQQG